MNTKDLERFKKMLSEEKAELERELSSISRKEDGKTGTTWQPTANDIEVDSADENEVADKLEELEENAGIVAQLEKQLAEINNSLDKIEKGTYGLCEICGQPIEIERLEANPSARTSIKHGH